MPKPKIIVNCVASRYTDNEERIIEFTNGKRSQSENLGGLISLRNMPDGTLLVCVYRQDKGVQVVTGTPNE